MKYLMLSLVFVLTGIGYAQQDASNAKSEGESSTYKSDFATAFADDEDKVNFKKLRHYLNEKEIKKNQLEASIQEFNPEDVIEVKAKIEYCKTEAAFIGDGYTSTFNLSFKTENGTKVFSAQEDPINADFINNVIIPELEKAKEYFEGIPAQNKSIEDQIQIVDFDIQSVQEQIDVALAPEREDQTFRAKISFYFTVMIGVLLLGFFVIIGFRSDKNIGRELLSEVGLQFVTMFVLIIAVILFGILGILEAKELTAILSGVSGYILGKGATAISSKKDDSNAPTPAPAVAAPSTPAPEVISNEGPTYSTEPISSPPSDPPTDDSSSDDDGAVG